MSESHYCAFEITENGMALRQRAIAGGKKDEALKVDFTRGVIGQGRPEPGTDIYYMSELVNPAADVPIKESYAKSNSHIMVVVIDGLKLDDDILMTEIGIYCRLIDAVTGAEIHPEILYGYTFTNKYDFIPAGSDYNLHREIAFNTVLSRAGKFEIVFDKTMVYVTHRDLEEILERYYEEKARLYPLNAPIRHDTDTYPEINVIEFGFGCGVSPCEETPCGGTNGKKVRCSVEYLDSDTIQIFTEKEYGVVQSITPLSQISYLITFIDSPVSLYVKLQAYDSGTVENTDRIITSAAYVSDVPPNDTSLLWLKPVQ